MGGGVRVRGMRGGGESGRGERVKIYEGGEG